MMAYIDSLRICVAVLVLKVVIVTLGTVRARLVSDNFKFHTRGLPNPEDESSSVIQAALKLFKVVMLVPTKLDATAVAPTAADPEAPAAAEQEGVPGAAFEAAATDSIERWVSVHRNSVEQETFFIGVALALHVVSLADPPGDFASIVLYAGTACRVLHAVAYVCKMQPYRTIFFVVTLSCSAILAVLLLLSA
eukprot:COSAG02_NODE_2081_length_9898_cov_45.797539_6_plen_193_part_00